MRNRRYAAHGHRMPFLVGTWDRRCTITAATVFGQPTAVRNESLTLLPGSHIPSPCLFSLPWTAFSMLHKILQPPYSNVTRRTARLRHSRTPPVTPSIYFPPCSPTTSPRHLRGCPPFPRLHRTWHCPLHLRGCSPFPHLRRPSQCPLHLRGCRTDTSRGRTLLQFLRRYHRHPAINQNLSIGRAPHRTDASPPLIPALMPGLSISLPPIT